MNLPIGWELKELQEYPGRVYYYNKVTHASTWIRPLPYPGLQTEIPPLISVMHILIKYKDDTTKPITNNENVKIKHRNLTKEEAKQKIDDIFLKITEGQKFEEIAKKESDKSCNIGWISRGTLDPKFEDVAWSLDIGELSRPIETDDGWQIILRNG